MTPARLLLRLNRRLPRRGKTAALAALDGVALPLALVAALAIEAPAEARAGRIGDVLPLLPLLALAAAGLSALAGPARTPLRDLGAPAVRQGARHALLAALGAAALLPPGVLTPAGGVLLGLAVFALGLGLRTLLRDLLCALQRRAAGVTRVILYGAGSTGLQLAAALVRHDTIEPVAFVDDNPALHGRRVAGLRVHPAHRIEALARESGAGRVILAIPSLPGAQRAQLLLGLRRRGLEAVALPSLGDLVQGEGATPVGAEAVSTRDLLQREPGAPAEARHAAAYRGTSVLVSGAGGSIGSELCRQLLRLAPRRLVLLEPNEHALFTIDRELRALACGTEIVPVLGSVTDARLVRDTLRRHAVQTVLHAAAYKHVPIVEANPVAGLVNNVAGTRVLAREAVAARVRRFVLISSDKAVRPAGVMGASKRAAELVVQDLASRSHTTRFAAVRFGNVLGSSGSVVPVFREQIAAGGPVTVTHPDATRFFMTAEEAVQLVLAAGAEAEGGEIFALDMGRPVRIAEIARRMIRASGRTPREPGSADGDIEIAYTGLRPGEKLHEAAMTEGARPTGVHPSVLRVAAPTASEIEVAAILRAVRDAAESGTADEALDLIGRAVRDHALPGRRRSAFRSPKRRRPPAPASAAPHHARLSQAGPS